MHTRNDAVIRMLIQKEYLFVAGGHSEWRRTFGGRQGSSLVNIVKANFFFIQV